MTKFVVLAVLLTASSCALSDSYRIRALERAQELYWDSQGELDELQTKISVQTSDQILRLLIQRKQSEVKRDRQRLELEMRRLK